MIKTIPHPDNPFYPYQSELAMAWELGWQKCDEQNAKKFMECLEFAVVFRKSVRIRLFSYMPNNPCTTDNELLMAIDDLIQINEKGGKKK